LSGYYLIGFRVLPADRQGNHSIRIATARSRISIVARSQFSIPAASRTVTSAAARTTSDPAAKRRDPFSSVSIDKTRLRVATHSASDANGTMLILLSVDVQEVAAHPITALALGYKLVAGDRVVSDSGRVVPVAHAPDGAPAPISYVAFRNVPPGRYSLQL